jgi:hypothetical protein
MKSQHAFEAYHRITGNDPTAAAILVLADAISGLYSQGDVIDRGDGGLSRELRSALFGGGPGSPSIHDKP